MNRVSSVIQSVGFSVSKGRKFVHWRLYLSTLMRRSEFSLSDSSGDLFAEMVFHLA